METINKPGFQASFVNTEDYPLKTKFICYYTVEDGDNIYLMRVVEEFYKHPDAVVSVIRRYVTASDNKYHKRCAHIMLLKHAQENAQNIEDSFK